MDYEWQQNSLRSNNKYKHVLYAYSNGHREIRPLEWSPNAISKWCREGLIKDASQDAKGSPWHIPKDAKCPKPIKKVLFIALSKVF